ncbi:MAG: ABC transporter permease [bacterium]
MVFNEKMHHTLGIIKQLIKQNIDENYMNSSLGPGWIIIQPLLLFATYAFVFTYIFDSRLPDSYDVSFIAYMALAFWPWTSLSEGVLAGTNSIVENKGLINKVAIKPYLFIISRVSAAFFVNLIGYAFIMTILAVNGSHINWIKLPLLLIPIFALYAFSVGIALITSTLQVFIRDTKHLVQFTLTALFFLSPILYPPSMIPAKYRFITQLNPFSSWLNMIRDMLLFKDLQITSSLLFSLLSLLLTISIGIILYKRCSHAFEDYL